MGDIMKFKFKFLPHQCPNRNMNHVPIFNDNDQFVCRLCGLRGERPRIGMRSFRQMTFDDLLTHSIQRDQDFNYKNGKPKDLVINSPKLIVKR